jgi:hypothetical protein
VFVNDGVEWYFVCAVSVAPPADYLPFPDGTPRKNKEAQKWFLGSPQPPPAFVLDARERRYRGVIVPWKGPCQLNTCRIEFNLDLNKPSFIR